MPFLYRALTSIAAPFISLYLRLRRARGKEDRTRFRERLGFPSLSRPSGKIVWCHAASVGEVLSVLSVLDEIGNRYPHWHILLTTGTETSANIVQSRLPANAFHQYIPVDRWPYVTRFLEHWEPDLVLWVESELWPNMLAGLAERHTPAILLNGRMSEKSYQRWRMIRGGVKQMLTPFQLGLVQTGVERNRYAVLGLENVHAVGNLKFAADPLPYDIEQLNFLKEITAGRPIWLMASTHAGEDEIALRLHRKLRLTWPDLLTFIVPRHPVRTDTISDLIANEGIPFSRRSVGQVLDKDIQIYLADTMGELGLFYRLCKVCCLAGSFTWGGHNPIEPALLRCAVVFGPKMDNFAVMADDMLAQGAAIQVGDEAELTEVITRLIKTPLEAEAFGNRAKAWADEKHSVLDKTLEMIAPFFKEQP